MIDRRAKALTEFRRMIAWIALIAVLMAFLALAYLYFDSALDASTVIIVTLGVFLSVLLGCGLFAAAFFSEKSGHDQRVTDVTRSEREHQQGAGSPLGNLQEFTTISSESTASSFSLSSPPNRASPAGGQQ